MRVRNYAAGAAAAIAVVAGIAAAQSGIPGTGPLPVTRHTGTSAQDGAGLPAPGEVGRPLPTAGAVQGTPVVVRSVPRTTATQAGVRVPPGDEKPAKADRSGKGKSNDDSHGTSAGKGKSGSGKDG